MRHFVIILKVICLRHILTLVTTKTIHGPLPNMKIVANFINKYLKPYINSMSIPQNTSRIGFRTGIETPVQSVIRKKIQELKPYLNDDDLVKIDNDDNIMLDGSEETTIIEFTPSTKRKKDIGRNRKPKSDAFKADIQVYKKLRDKITKALKKEPVSDKTTKLVTKTFDGLIAKMIGSQCMWKSSDRVDRTLRFGKNDADTLFKMQNMTKEEWEHFKHLYANLTKSNFVNETLALFNKMQGFFTKIVRNTATLSKRYKVKCQLVEMNKQKKPIINDYNILRDSTDVDDCPEFQICSNELKMFMTDFYNSLNDTSVSAFRNYAAMYARDVTTEASFEKDSVIDLINNVSNTVERRVNKLFIKETKNIKLDPNKNKHNNIKLLIHYINSTTGHVKRHIKKHLERYLKSLKGKLLLNVKKDIDVNLSVDLGNLARDFISRICTIFIRCNSKYVSRRDIYSRGNLNIKDGKSVYVKVQLTFDDELKNTLVRNRQYLLSTVKGISENRKQGTLHPVKNNFQRINITRTTSVTRKSSKVTKQNPVKNIPPSAEVKDIFIEMKPIDNVLSIV